MRLAPASLLILLLAACSPQPPAFTGGDIDALAVEDTVVGDGNQARVGDLVSVHYTGWLHDASAPEGRGERFDTSLERGRPFEFRIGAGRVIRGWDEGVAGMREGGRRVLMVPAEYGYGDRGASNVIPPGASLVFEVELLGIVDPPRVSDR